ncbi:hypothetical protein E2C01_043707 [Portunus trituberculatus]|uniref:Uncharacterized protein n=1 Tax=Portunus trituberculatus TaxID=210409 RepID=A0A5B7FY12_PORTR|nr:hypothetical protein [Portunus trituberculatus]
MSGPGCSVILPSLSLRAGPLTGKNIQLRRQENTLLPLNSDDSLKRIQSGSRSLSGHLPGQHLARGGPPAAQSVAREDAGGVGQEALLPGTRRVTELTPKCTT